MGKLSKWEKEGSAAKFIEPTSWISSMVGKITLA